MSLLRSLVCIILMFTTCMYTLLIFTGVGWEALQVTHLKDCNSNTLKTGCPNLQVYFDNEMIVSGVPLSKFNITQAEILANLGNADWYLNKMIAFGSAIVNLTQAEDLLPGPVADTLFGGLVALAREFPSFDTAQIMSNPIIKQLRPRVIEICGIAEYFLEVFNAKKLIHGDLLLKKFIYYENYRLLMKFEAKRLRLYFGKYRFERIQKVVFIGSGPLPLSSIELIQHLPANASIVNYDQNEEAMKLGAAVVASQNLSNRIFSVKCSALDITDLRTADVVYLAALAGHSNIEKQQIISHFYEIMKPGAVVVARSATGLRTFLYQSLSSRDFLGFQDFRHFNPKNKVIINSVAMALKRS